MLTQNNFKCFYFDTTSINLRIMDFTFDLALPVAFLTRKLSFIPTSPIALIAVDGNLLT